MPLNIFNQPCLARVFPIFNPTFGFVNSNAPQHPLDTKCSREKPEHTESKTMPLCVAASRARSLAVLHHWLALRVIAAAACSSAANSTEIKMYVSWERPHSGHTDVNS